MLFHLVLKNSLRLSIGVGSFFMGVLVVRVEVRTCPLRVNIRGHGASFGGAGHRSSWCIMHEAAYPQKFFQDNVDPLFMSAIPFMP